VSAAEVEYLIQQSGIREEVENIAQEFAQYSQEMIDELKEWDVTLNDGLEDLPWDTTTESTDWTDTLQDLPEEVIDEILAGEVFTIEEEPSIEESNEGEFVFEEPSIESVESVETGLVGAKPERRRIKNSISVEGAGPKRIKNAISVENVEKLKKGPLWDFRTNRSNDHLFED
jgi:hypothetical protein